MSNIRVNQSTVQSTSAPQAKQTSASKKAQPQRGATHIPQPATVKETGTISQTVSTTLPKQAKRKERKKTDTKDCASATKGKAPQSMQTAAGLVSYTNDEIKRLTRISAGTQETPEDAHAAIQKRIQRGFDLTTSVLDGAKTTKPNKQDIADIMLFLDAKARASQRISPSASFSIADPEGRLDKYLNSCESAHDGSASGASNPQGRKLVHAIDFGNVAGPLANGKQSVAFGAFQIDGQKHLFLKALNQGYRINVETVKDTGARLSATGDSSTSTPKASGTSTPAPLSSMATSASAKADVSDLTSGEEQKFITNAYRTFQDAVAKVSISGLTCADQTEIYAMVKEVKAVIAHANSLTEDNAGKIILLMAVETFAQTWADHGSNFSHLDRRIGDESIFTLAELKDEKYANNLSAQSKEAISDVKAFRATILNHLRAQMGLAQINTTSLPSQDSISSLMQEGAKTTPQSTVTTAVADQGISIGDAVPAGFKLFSQDISTNIVQNTASGTHKNTCFILAPIRAMLENPNMRTALMNRIYQGPNGEFCIKLKYMNQEYSVIVKPDDEDYKQYVQPEGRQPVVTALECAITRFYTTMVEPAHTYGTMGEASRVAGLLGLSNNVDTSAVLNNILRGSTTPQQKAAELLRILQQRPNVGFVLSSGDNGHFVQFKLTGDNNIQIGNSLTSRILETRAGVISSRQASTYTLTLDAFVRHMPSTAAISCYMLDEQAQTQAKSSTAQTATEQASRTSKPLPTPPSKLTVKSDEPTVQPTITAKAKPFPTPPVTPQQVQVTLNDITDDFKIVASTSGGYTRPRNTATASAQTAASATTAATNTAVTAPASTTTVATAIKTDSTPISSTTETAASIIEVATEDDTSPISSANLPSGSAFDAIPAGFTQMVFHVNNNASFQTQSPLVNLIMQQILTKIPMQSELTKRVTFKQSGPFFSRKYVYCVQLNGNDGQPIYVKVVADDFPKNTKHPNMQAALAAALSKFYPQSDDPDDIDALDDIDAIKHIVAGLGLQYQTIQQAQLQDTVNQWNIDAVGVLQGISGVVFQPTQNKKNINVSYPQPRTTDAPPDMWISFEDYKKQQEALASSASTTLKSDRELRQDYQKQYHPILSPRNSAVTPLKVGDFVRGASVGVDELSIMPQISLITAKK